jgi:hypothetical protein
MIRKLSASLAGESVLLLGLTATVLVALNVPTKWQDVVQAAVPLLLALAVRSVTSSPATVAKAVTEAATQTAQSLTTTSVGKAGEVSSAGLATVEGVTTAVLNTVGGLVPALVNGGKP